MPPTLVILGAGPAGLALATKLLQRPDRPRVVVIEREPVVGGLSASHDCDGIHFDYGSHRLHETTREDILGDLQALLGADLLHRPRRGRILVQGRLVGYPLAPLDLMLHLPPSFLLRFGLDLVSSPFRRAPGASAASYADVLRASLGTTLCESFYFPFARKLWGLAPEEISAEQARRRVSAGSLGKMLRRVAAALPGVKAPAAGHGYYYPRRGFGQISTALAERVRQQGGEIRLSTVAERIDVESGRVTQLHLRTGGATGPGDTLQPDVLFSTIPAPSLVAALHPLAPSRVAESAQRLRYRAIRFCYLVLGVDRVTPYDAHYFPQTDLCFSRVSEAKNYTGTEEPRGRTGLCAEIPFFPGDAVEDMSEQELGQRVLADLARAGIAVNAPVERVFTRRYDHAYPVYDLSYERHLSVVRDHLAGVANLKPFGRQSDFTHDNLHHALEVAYAVAECLGDDLRWDDARWRAHQRLFAQHVVVD